MDCANADRRRLLLGLGAAAAGLALPGRLPFGAAVPQEPWRIDVHSHLAPPAWVQKLTPDGVVLPPMANWSVQRHLDDMDRAGVATAITSVTSPGLWLSDRDAARALARACNDYAATLRQAHPGRFGMFVVLPMPDIEGSLRELEYGLDTLGADGICLFTNYAGKWLGDPAFDQLMAELDRRKAIAYTHPVAAACCRNLVPGINEATIEFGTDTTRALARWVFSGSAARFPGIRFIFSHAGGTMPYLAERFDLWSRTPPNPTNVPLGFRAHAQRFYYDVAQSSNAVTLAALKAVVPTPHILFGTDYPFRTAVEHVASLEASGIFSSAELRGIAREHYLAMARA
jgi:predicted TIM-barrel fold metal-dependent hydrolase